MPQVDITTLDRIREVCQRIEGAKRSTAETKQWIAELGQFLSSVRMADEATRATVDFQKRLWDSNPVASVGQGNIAVTAAIADEPFRQWLAVSHRAPGPPHGRFMGTNGHISSSVHHPGRCNT